MDEVEVSGGSGATAWIDLPKDAVKCPLQSPLSPSQMHYLPLVWCTLSPLPCNPSIETSWPPDKDLFYPLCLNITQMHCQVFRHGVCLQSGWLRIIWKWERGLWCTVVVVGVVVHCGGTDFDQNWSDRDWSRLIRLWEAKNRQWISEN